MVVNKGSSVINKIKRFLLAKLRWQNAGSPVRPPEEILRIYNDVCVPCEEFDNDSCSECGCRIKPRGTQLNKLAWATEECPLGKWEATFDPNDVSSLPKGGKGKKKRRCSSCGKKKTA